MKTGEKLHALTSIKGIFIWIIVLHNTFLIDALLENIPGMSFIRLFGGSLGNSMFFMLSGFLMSWGYRDRLRSGNLFLGDFLRKRLRKLYPVYALSNLAALAVTIWQYGISAVNLKKLAFTFLLLQGGGLDAGNPYNSPTWFVSALFFCYILYYGGTCRAKNHTAYRVFLAAGIGIGYYFSEAELQIPLCYAGNGVAYLNFFLGCALAEVYPELEKRFDWMKTASMAGLAGSMYLMLRYGVEVISGGSGTAFAFVICPMVLYLAYAEGVCSRILRGKIFVFLGQISMGVFYWHLVLYFGLRYALGGMTQVRYGLYLLVVLLAGFLTEGLSQKKKQKNVC